ncbi:MAG: (d)CMP kinase [Thermacetogeniaceae bacterium]
MFRPLAIAIDGPAGSGKSTVARRVAHRLGFLYVDTGAMYRAVTYLALRSSVNLDDESELFSFVQKLRFSLVHFLKSGEVFLWCNGEDLTPHLRTREVSRFVSKVAAVPAVRRQLVSFQRFFAQGRGVVMEGRDIGTVVLPDADYKFFLTASLDVRVSRREKELLAQGKSVDREELRRELMFRDEMDCRREVGPLKVAADAMVIDTTSLGVEEVVGIIIREIEEKERGGGG